MDCSESVACVVAMAALQGRFVLQLFKLRYPHVHFSTGRTRHAVNLLDFPYYYNSLPFPALDGMGVSNVYISVSSVRWTIDETDYRNAILKCYSVPFSKNPEFLSRIMTSHFLMRFPLQ